MRGGKSGIQPEREPGGVNHQNWAVVVRSAARQACAPANAEKGAEPAVAGSNKPGE